MGKYYRREYSRRRIHMRENRKIVPGLAGTKKYPAGGILKSRFNPARRLRHLNNQPPKHPCFSIYAWWVFERAEGFQLPASISIAPTSPTGAFVSPRAAVWIQRYRIFSILRKTTWYSVPCQPTGSPDHVLTRPPWGARSRRRLERRPRSHALHARIPPWRR